MSKQSMSLLLYSAVLHHNIWDDMDMSQTDKNDWLERCMKNGNKMIQVSEVYNSAFKRKLQLLTINGNK